MIFIHCNLLKLIDLKFIFGSFCAFLRLYQDLNFFDGIENSGRFEHNSPVSPQLDFKGTPIGVNDLHIAGHAPSEGLTLVSNNLREFERVDALRLVNWA